MLIGYIGYYIGRGNIAVAIPLLSRQFGYSNEQLGIILTVSELAYALGKFTTGPLADKIGGKFVFLLGIAGAIFFNLLFPQFHTLLMFTVVWSFCRFFLSMGWGGIIKIIGEWYEPERSGTIMGVISINFQFGAGVAALFCGLLIDLGVGSERTFLLSGPGNDRDCDLGVFRIQQVRTTFIQAYDTAAPVPAAKRSRDFANIKGTAGSGRSSKGFFAFACSARFSIFSFLSHMLRSIFLIWTPELLVDLGMPDASAAYTCSRSFPILGSPQ